MRASALLKKYNTHPRVDQGFEDCLCCQTCRSEKLVSLGINRRVVRWEGGVFEETSFGQARPFYFFETLAFEGSGLSVHDGRSELEAGKGKK